MHSLTRLLKACEIGFDLGKFYLVKSSARKPLNKVVAIIGCKIEFMKQVFPRFLSPQGLNEVDDVDLATFYGF